MVYVWKLIIVQMSISKLTGTSNTSLVVRAIVIMTKKGKGQKKKKQNRILFFILKSLTHFQLINLKKTIGITPNQPIAQLTKNKRNSTTYSKKKRKRKTWTNSWSWLNKDWSSDKKYSSKAKNWAMRELPSLWRKLLYDQLKNCLTFQPKSPKNIINPLMQRKRYLLQFTKMGK